MPWVNPTTRTTGELITASIFNTDLVANLIELRAGGIAIASQAALDFLYASSATQLGRVAKGTGLQYLRMNAAANAYEFATPSLTLLKEGAGTDSSAGATNLDTYAMASSLTIKDTLLVFARLANTGSAANINITLHNTTDNVSIGSVQAAANTNYYVERALVMAQTATKVGFLSTAGALTRSTFVTNFTGNWTLALRHGGITAPDTLEWEWALYRLAGQ